MNTITDILSEELDQLRADIIIRHEKAGQVASGRTRDALEVKVTDLTSGQLLGPAYSGVLEKGRKEGGVPKDFIDILKRWAAAKGITFSDEKQLTRWANAVKWKIIREGSKLYRSRQTEDIFTTPYESFGDRLYGRIAAYYEQDIKNQIFEQ